jgi:hypothetical protein
MNIKKLLAGSLAAIAAGATLLVGIGAVSSSLGDYVVTSDGSLTSPIIVVGSAAKVDDVLSAADIAAAVAGYATTTTTVAGTTTTTVTDGVRIDTTSTKIYLGDALTKSGLKTTITKSDLPTLLASGTFTDDAGNTYKYDQYITFQTGTVTYGKSGGDLSDPALYIDTGTSTSTPLFELSVVFNKLLNISSTNVRGNTIEIFGGKYTIGSNSDFTSSTKKLELFGSSNSQLLSEGEEKTITINNVEHTVKLLGVSSSTIAVISVDGESKEVTQGNSYSIAGVDVYVDSVYYYPKEAQVSQAKLSFGSQKLILENGAAVKVGQSEDTVEGTLVTLTGTAGSGISKLTVAVTAKSSSEDYILAGSAFTDPVFESVKVAFNGMETGSTDSIVIDNSGTTAATLKFTDYRGNEKTLTWAYTGSSSFAPALNATSTRAYHVVEGETVKKNDYILLTPSQESEFSHIMQYTTASSIGSSGAYIELKDVMSGDTHRIYLTDSGYASADFYIDGQQYFVKNVSSTDQTFKFYWGSGASATSAGDKVTVFPLIKAKGGEWITLTTPVDLTSGVTYELPTNTSFTYTVGVHNGTVQTFGRVKYNITSAGQLRLADTNGNALTYPAVLILEEKGKNTANSDVQDAIIVTVKDGTGTGVDLAINTPVLTAATQSSATMESDNSVTMYMDRYGTVVKYDTDSQGLVEITYPDEQSTAVVAVGTDPKFTTAAGGTTLETAVKITEPVAKLDTEIDTTALTGDLILVGGPCVNTLVAELLKDTVTCETWAYTTGIIKEVENAFESGHKALIVAGTTKDDTRSLAAKVMKGTLSFEA